MQHTTAYELAQDLQAQLSSACVRIELAGSLRRGKAEVGDIELVAIASTGLFTTPDLFGNPSSNVAVNHLDDALTTLYAQGQWRLARNPETRKPLRNGDAWKKLQHAATGLLCDLFITDRRRWGYTLAIRTGPSEFSKELVTRALYRKNFFKDGLLHNHAPVRNAQREVQPCPAGADCPSIIPTPEERDIFTALGLPYIEPDDRTRAALIVAQVIKAL